MKKLRELLKGDCPTILIGMVFGDGNPNEWVVQWYAYDWYSTKGSPTRKAAIDEFKRIVQLSQTEQEKYLRE